MVKVFFWAIYLIVLALLSFLVLNNLVISPLTKFKAWYIFSIELWVSATKAAYGSINLKVYLSLTGIFNFPVFID